MTCPKAKKLIPLYAGGDLRPRLLAAVRAHVDSCPSCWRELRDTQLALARIKAAAKEESLPDWSDVEWRALMARVRPAAREARRPVVLARPRWAAASVLGAVIGLAVMSLLIRDGNLGPRETSAANEPSVVSLTLVSQETGLQVVWFLDKNFEWKGDEK
jgi:predicted anti-sigma-YlaC factor YlaD